MLAKLIKPTLRTLRLLSTLNCLPARQSRLRILMTYSCSVSDWLFYYARKFKTGKQRIRDSTQISVGGGVPLLPELLFKL